MVNASESEQVSTEKITSKYIHPTKEAKEGADAEVPGGSGSEQVRRPPSLLETLATQAYKYLCDKAKDFINYELGEHVKEYTKVTYPDVLCEDGSPISVEIENHTFSKPPHANQYTIHPNVPWKGQWDFIIIILVMMNGKSMRLVLSQLRMHLK